LAADVRHYLASEPISVGRPTLRYRAAKFIRRRRRAIAIYGLAASFCIAAVAAGASIWRARGLAREVARGEFMGAQIEALRNPQEAIDQLTQLAGEHPNYLEPQVALAYLFFRENRIPESIEAAGRVLTEDPANGPAHLLLSIVYRHRDPERAEEHRRRGHEVVSDDRYYRALALPASESAEAASILSDVLVEQGTNFDARWARAWRYFELGRYDKMLEDANYLVQSRRDSATALNTRGVALNGLDRFNEALDAFSRALEITPDHASTYLNRAGVYFSQGQVALGLADCQRAIAKEPNFAEAYAYRAFARQMMGKLEEASADCAQALRLQPRNATARWVRSRILRQQGNLAAAAGEVEQALVIQPNNVDFRVDRAGMMMGLGEYEQAFADYSAVCTRRETAEARHGRGLAASRVGAYDIALADFDRAIELDGRRAQYFGSRARLYRWMGEYQRALADNDKAVELAPDVLDGYASRGVSRWLAGDLGGAVKDFEKGLSIDAGRGAPQLLWLWQIHGMRGDSEAASAALAKAAELVRDPWLSHIVAFLRGTKTEQQLLEKAAGDRQRFDVYYYLGAKASAEGQNDDAQRWFQKCVNRDYVQDTEYDLALGLLAGLRQ
jgi:tetratricopeptide (TPR) repeat protein